MYESVYGLDAALTDVVDVFHTEGVELVRLSGLTRRVNRIIKERGGTGVSTELVYSTVLKMRERGIVSYAYELHCPYCHETSWVVAPPEKDASRVKACDTCGQVYGLTAETMVVPSLIGATPVGVVS